MRICVCVYEGQRDREREDKDSMFVILLSQKDTVSKRPITSRNGDCGGSFR